MAITKDQLISDLAEAVSLPKATVRTLIDQLGEIVGDALENDGEITLPGIGKLKVSERPARTGSARFGVGKEVVEPDADACGCEV